jgi:L-rhamnose mutarotase
MPRVMFTISYGIKPELRDQYLTLVKEMKAHVTSVGRKNYSVFETKGKKNQFTEVFITNSVEEFDALEDNQDEKTEQLVSNLEEFIDEGGMKYATLVELE